MTTRYDKKISTPGVLESGYEGSNVPQNFSIPSCGIEDVDRAFFELFDKVLPFTYVSQKNNNEVRKVPVVFATGERFALNSKKSPIRDKNDALILPIISISRSSIEQEASKTMGVSDRYNEMVIKKRITSEDQLYQSLKNTQGFKNSPGEGEGNDLNKLRNFYSETGRLLQPDLKKGLYEVITIPTPKYFTVKYQITFWSQYVKHLNEMITTLMGSYIQPGNRTIKITTEKGYWFIAYFEQSFSSESNLDSFSDDERIVKSSITAEVPAYLILPDVHGTGNGLRSFISAPTISFGTHLATHSDTQKTPVPSGNIDTYLLSEIATDDTEAPSAMIGENGKLQSERIAGAEHDGTSSLLKDSKSSGSAVGNVETLKTRTKKLVYSTDPVTGEKTKVIGKVIDSNPSKGEETIIIDDFANL